MYLDVMRAYGKLDNREGEVGFYCEGHTVVGRALRSNEDCSYHSILVLKYGILAEVVCFPLVRPQ